MLSVTLISKSTTTSQAIHEFKRFEPACQRAGLPTGKSVMVNEALTRRIIGCAMRVHSTLGNGFQELIYQRALAIELELDHLNFAREQDMTIYYRDRDIGTRRVDFFVENSVIVEIKATTKLEDVHLAQVLNYLECYKIHVGLLINFGQKSLEFKRVHNNKLNLDL